MIFIIAPFVIVVLLLPILMVATRGYKDDLGGTRR